MERFFISGHNGILVLP